MKPGEKNIQYNKTPNIQLISVLLYRKRRQMQNDGLCKIIDVAVKKTSHSIHLPKQSHQTKSQEFPEHFHSFTDIIFQFKFQL
jgi:hypothetical protein